MNTKTTKVVLYSRVSTAHNGQNPELQLSALRSYAAARGWVVVKEITDHGISGRTDNRSGLREVMKLASSREIDCVVITRLDRLFRSTRHLLNVMAEWSAVGITLISIAESIDVSTPQGRLFLTLLAALGAFEAETVREKVVQSLQFAKQNGVRLGRPRKHDHDKIRQLHTAGMSCRKIAKTIGAPRSVVWRAITGGGSKTPSKSGLQLPENVGVEIGENDV